MTTSRENGCTYWMAAHSTVPQMQNVTTAVIDALRNDTPIAVPKLQALHCPSSWFLGPMAA